MERPLRQRPSSYPGALAWSGDNILAVGQEKSVAVLNPADLATGDAGFVVLKDDTSPVNGDPDSVFPEDIVEQRRHVGAIAMRAMLHRPARPEVAARQVVWSPVWDVPGETNKGPRCFLLVVSTSHAVTVHAPSARDTCSEWPEVCDLSRLEREARNDDDDEDDATRTSRIPPAPSVPRETSSAFAELLARASERATLPAPPAPPAPPASAARTPARSSLPASAPPVPPPPPPREALAEGARVEVLRGARQTRWLPATVSQVHWAYVFRAKVRYDVAPETGEEEEWLVFEERAKLFVASSDASPASHERGSRFAVDHARDAAIGSWFEFPSKNCAVHPEGYALRPSAHRGVAAEGVRTTGTDAAVTAATEMDPPKDEFADARPYAALVSDANPVRDSGSDEDDVALVALVAPVAKKARVEKTGKASCEAYESRFSSSAREAAKKAIDGRVLGVEEAAKIAARAVFEAAPASEETLAAASRATNAKERLGKKAWNAATLALGYRVRDAWMVARSCVGIETVYGKGKHLDKADKACLEETTKAAWERVARAMANANLEPTKRALTETKERVAKEAQISARKALGAAATAVDLAASKDADSVMDADADADVDAAADHDDEPLINLASFPRIPPASDRITRGAATVKGGASDRERARRWTRSSRRAERLAAVSAAWSASSTIAVGAKSGDVVLWTSRPKPAVGDAGACAGVAVRRLGSTRVADAWVTALAWADEGSVLVAGASDGSVNAWRVVEASGGKRSKDAPRENALRLERELCAPDGIAVTTLAVDVASETPARLVAVGKASGAATVFDAGASGWIGTRTRTRTRTERVFFEPVAGVAWCASPVAGSSRLVMTSPSGRSAAVDVRAALGGDAPAVSTTDEEGRSRLEWASAGAGAGAPPRLDGAAKPDGLDVPEEFHAGLAASPSGVFLARSRAFQSPTNIPGGANEHAGRMMIAARTRRGAVTVEPALGGFARLEKDSENENARLAAAALEARVERVAATGTANASLWDMRVAAEALGAAGIAAATRGAARAEEGTSGAAKIRATRMKNALVARLEKTVPEGSADAFAFPSEGLGCRACGRAEDPSGRWCARCGIPLRPRIESTMGLKSVVI